MGTPAYDKANTRRINLKLNNKTDADIIAALEAQENIQGYLKLLIRADQHKAESAFRAVRTSAKQYSCGVCGTELVGRPRYCGNCGQMIMWSR